MSYKNRFISFILLVAVISCSIVFSAGALFEKETAIDKFYNYEQMLIGISYRGDTVNYPENSLEAVKSAFKKGADFVSVNIEKTSDGVFYLCENESLGNVCDAPYDELSQVSSAEIKKYNLFDIYGRKTDYKLISLSDFLDETDTTEGIILDVSYEYLDGVYTVLKDASALGRVIIRVKESALRLTEWAADKADKPNLIAVYGGNIIFSTVNYINTFTKAEMPAVQYESKNYFNVAFGDFFVNRYLNSVNVRAVAATYSPDLCGQRGDSSDGWNELIKKGYSVIETNNIESFVEYRNETERLKKEIADLVYKAFCVDPSKYSEVSLSNLNDAKLYGETLTSTPVFSLDAAQQAYSKLIYALEDMKISSGEVDTRGALNVTPGKIIASLLVGAALFAWQVYVYKMRRGKKENKC